MAALKVACDLARHDDGTLFILHVVPMIIPPMGLPVYVHLYRGEQKHARNMLEELAGKLLVGLKYEVLIRLGDPADMILTVAKNAGADVVVMAAHPRRGFSRLLPGVADQVMRGSSCPVLIVYDPRPQNHPRVAWTGSSQGSSASTKLTARSAALAVGEFVA